MNAAQGVSTMVRRCFLLLFTAMILALPASAKEVVITSDPPAAEVLVDGRLLGRTPLTTRKAELLPNWTTDGRITKATIVIRKAGYEDFRVFIGEFSVPSRVDAKLKLIASTENLENYLESNSVLEAMTMPASESVIRTSHDLDATSEELYSQGYLLVGYAGYVAEAVVPEQLRVSAAKLEASLVLINSEYLGERAAVREVSTRSGGSFAATGVFSPSMAGPITAFTFAPGQAQTHFVPFSERQFRNQALFWRKRKPNPLGVFADYLPDPLRRELQRNTGALVVGIEQDGPAFLANILTGDVIVAIGGTPVHAPADLERILKGVQGESEIEVIRDGRSVRLRVRTGT